MTQASLKEVEVLLRRLKRLCEHFVATLKQEEEAIRAHHIGALEKVCQEKELLAEEFAGGVKRLRELLSSYCQHSQALALQDISSLHLTDLYKALLALQASQKELKTAEASLLARIVEAIPKLLTEFQQVKPLLEKNRYVIAQLLEHHQQSYRFWSDLAKEQNGVYDQQGGRKKQERLSQLSVGV